MRKSCTEDLYVRGKNKGVLGLGKSNNITTNPIHGINRNLTSVGLVCPSY